MCGHIKGNNIRGFWEYFIQENSTEPLKET